MQTHQTGEIWHSAALIRAAVVEKGKTLPTQLILEQMNRADWQPELPEWIKAWIQADALWPWSKAK